jgi:hypothetical protein
MAAIALSCIFFLRARNEMLSSAPPLLSICADVEIPTAGCTFPGYASGDAMACAVENIVKEARNETSPFLPENSTFDYNENVSQLSLALSQSAK